MNWGFASLPIFDHLTALSKMTLGRWKEVKGEASYAVCFTPAGPLCIQPRDDQELQGNKRTGCQCLTTHGSKE